MRPIVTYALILALLPLGACGGGGKGGPQLVFQPILLDLGFELYQSTGDYNADLPLDFFAPGSDPFVGVVPVCGDPIGPVGPFETGLADTVLERLDRMNLGLPPDEQPIPIELVALHLVSCQPIVVTYGGLNPEPWTLDVTLDPSVRTDGVMQMRRTQANGGTFTSTFAVQATFTFTRAGPPGQALLPVTLNGMWDGTWSTLPDPAAAAYRRAVRPLAPGFLGAAMFVSPELNLQLMPAMHDPLAPGPAMVDPTAVIDPQVGSLGRGCAIGPGAVIGPGAIIGPGATIGGGCQVGMNALVGDLATLSMGSAVGSDAMLGTRTSLGMGAGVGAGSRLGDDCLLGDGATVGANCRMGDRGQLGIGAQLGDGVTAEGSVVLGDGSVVPAGLFLAQLSNLPPLFTATESFVRCVDASGMEATVPVSQCGNMVVQHFARGFVPGFDNATGGVEPPGTSVAPVNPGALPADLQNLANDVGSDIAPPLNGGTGTPYAPTTNDCDDFAEALRVKLAGLGYTTTFTVIYDVNPDRKWGQIWKPKLINGHALTDVHRAGDGTIWIEAQWTGAGGAVGIDIDDDNDGMVTYADGPGTDATDGGKRIEVYDSAQDATDSGRALD